ncbi:TPA: oxidoreductase, partial [Pasteurella multocida]|nr:oxidoreductase [Pasteurella multocida]
MNATLNVAIAAEFELSEKIAETLEQSQLNISQLSIVEIYPFNE